jgi:hypothetical protein
MNSIQLITLVTGTVCLLTSCDPSKQIILKNQTAKPAYFRWTVRTDSADTNSGPQYETVTFHLGTSKNDNEKTILFGFGSWPTTEIERFVREDIQSIEIESINEKIIMTDKKEIEHFLIKRRHGIVRNFITIKLK